MTGKKFINIIRDKNIVIPLYMYRFIRKLNINTDDFFVLMYLYNMGTKVQLDPSGISNDLGINLPSVMNSIDVLTKNDLIEMVVTKNNKNIMEEYISLDPFISKLSICLMGDMNDSSDNDDGDVFSLIEKEFARTLSPMEYEIVKAWLDNNVSVELIKEALREAIYNGVSNLRYIDKILYEWGKKGIKNKDDVEKSRKNFKEKKEEKVEVFDYDWLDDDDVEW